MLVTQAFEKLAAVVSAGARLPQLHRHVLPHPLNPLPDERVKAITREHLKGMIGNLLVEAPK